MGGESLVIRPPGHQAKVAGMVTFGHRCAGVSAHSGQAGRCNGQDPSLVVQLGYGPDVPTGLFHGPAGAVGT